MIKKYTLQSFLSTLTIVSFCLLSTALFAQSKVNKKDEKKFLKEADEEFKYGVYPLALEYYLKAHEANPQNPMTNYKIGVCVLETKGKEKALPYLENAYKLNPKVSDGIYYMLGQAYHHSQNFDRAISYFKKYLATSPDAKNNQKIVERKIYECENAKEFIASPVDIDIVNLGSNINSQNHDYSPVLSADENVLIFTSRRPNTTGGKLDPSGLYYEDLYISKKDESGEWGKPQNMSQINSDGHEASVGLSPDGKNLLIFNGATGNGDIYYCTQNKDGNWTKPKLLPKNISAQDSYEPSAVYSPDGNKIYFVSNRKGGYGGLDIWVSTVNKKGKWEDPINLGPTINTEGDEEAPFIDIDGKTMYFSSDRHKGMGGLDIFKSVFDEKSGTWSEPENLGYPINSTDSDIYFVLSGDGERAYFNSVKESGYGGEDIYMIRLPEPEDHDQRITIIENIIGKEYVKMIHEDAEELEAEEEIVEVVEEIKEEVIEEVVIEEIVEEEPVKEIRKEIVQAVPVILPITVAGTVKDQESGLVLPNSKVQLVNNQGKVVKEFTTNEDGAFIFTIQNDKAQKYSVSANLTGYLHKTLDVNVPKSTENDQVVEKDILLVRPKMSSKIVMRNIYYDFDKFTLRSESYNELDKLVSLLKENPAIKAEIASHTDSKGSNQYNINLSQKRSESVVNYLVKKGISKDRVIAKGYGEDRPLASNDDEEEGRELNRRTEFEIKGLK